MPSYVWAATAGKKYSLLVVDLLRPGSPYGSLVHFFAYNVCNGTEVTDGLNSTFGPWRAPSYRRFGVPGFLVHLLFEHDADLAFDLSDVSVAGQRAGAAAPTDLAAFMAVTGLSNTMLVSLNWITVRSSILSSATMELDRCACEWRSSPVPHSTDCLSRG